jgi:hypothetical protein
MPLARKPVKKLSNYKAIVCAFACLAFSSHAVSANSSKTYLTKGPIAVDVMEGLEWMRCSIGQVWSNETCVGEPMRLPYAATSAVLERTLASSGEGWRLPTRKELRALIEINDEPPMINAKYFPATHAGIYWTADNNQFLMNGHWVVNFYTGHSYGRAAKTQYFAIRLVKDR